jgi:flagellar motility protein MotE (MotC chaperone)
MKHAQAHQGDPDMGPKGHFSIGPWLIVLIFSAVFLKLLLAAANFATQPTDGPALFAPAEVLAKDQKKVAPQPAKKDPVDKPTAEMDGGKPGASPSVASPGETTGYLEKKEIDLRRREQHVQEQEQYLLQMQKDVEQKMQELIAIQKEIQVYRNEKSESKSANIRSLAQIYGSMKPKEAAKLLENMEEKLVVAVISTMKSTEAAEILSAMDFKKAAKVSEALTRR